MVEAASHDSIGLVWNVFSPSETVSGTEQGAASKYVLAKRPFECCLCRYDISMLGSSPGEQHHEQAKQILAENNPSEVSATHERLCVPPRVPLHSLS